MDRNGTTAGSENGAEINSEPTTSTDANRQADLPMANRRSLLHLIAPSDLSALGEPATQPHLQAFPSTIIDGKYSIVLSGIFASYSLNPGNWLMKN